MQKQVLDDVAARRRNQQNKSVEGSTFYANKLFLMVNDPMRRRIIRALVNGGWKTALELGVGPGSRRHTVLKHFTVLSQAGILVRQENPKDARQPLYALSPTAAVCKAENSFTVDFGRGMIRFS
ncbi:MAG: hypothetical protein JWM68_3605 [Verrucomicrobiales bacterium]|nr:hypothetical protein [Verrucomicrobiales bacterium]